MPKLNAKQQNAVENAESTDFSPLEEGVYTVKLRGVTVREGSGDPYWSTEWEVVANFEGDTKRAGRRLWENISTGDKSAWKMREFFDAMGYTYDSDTDEMIGDECQAVVTQVTIEQGKRAGQIGNQIERWLPIPEDGVPVDAGAPAGEGGRW